MDEPKKDPYWKNILFKLTKGENGLYSFAHDIAIVVAIVCCIGATLYVICGTWPAIVVIESNSMVPNMNVGDLVVVVDVDRFGNLVTWEEGKETEYTKFNNFGDVIIYRPNGITDTWAMLGLAPFSKQHPIIHRAMTRVESGQPDPIYASYNSEQETSAELLLISHSNISSDYAGYITKGDYNRVSDQHYLSIPDVGDIQRVKKEWVIGKALLIVPYVGLIPLHLTECALLILTALILHELYTRSRGKGPD